jgi:hypothetical protein
MRKLLALMVCCASLIFCAPPSAAQNPSPTVVFREPGFPSADTAVFPDGQFEKLFQGARFSSAEQLSGSLIDAASHLLILPYGSAFPEQAWSAIFAFLQRGGNLFVLGGRPFTRAAYHDASGWHLRDYSVRFIKELSIDQYQTTPGSDGTEFQNNPDVTFSTPRFSWQRAFSPIIRLSAVALYNRGGSGGSIDARVDALAWGVKDKRRMSAPLIQIDHLQNGFDGGRWIFLSAENNPQFYASADTAKLVSSVIERALRGAEEFTARPTLPLYVPGEPVEVEVHWSSTRESSSLYSMRISSFPELQEAARRSVVNVSLPASQTVVLPAPKEKGFHIIEAQLFEGDKIVATYHSGFWIRDLDYLRSGPKLAVNHDYFEFDGHPLAVVGTTYMSSEVQRLYFDHPNVFIWDRDLAQIHAAGLNMVRTGWWTGWDKFCDENGQPYERSLRTVEAYLMTARKNGLPVQFNFFAFLPEVLGGANAYLDAQAVHKEQTLVSAVVARFQDVPFLAWDLINEPSFSKRLWTMRPNNDQVESAAWNKWISQHYPDRAALAAAWNVPPDSIAGNISLPQEGEFNPRGMYDGRNSLRIFDYTIFAQESFANWVKGMREKIRATGSQQLITVGQDEGGFADRLNPAFFGAFVDFTTNHSWWQNDSLLWDSLVAKQPGVAMLIQETGLQRELTLDELARFTPEQEGALFERKVAMSFVQGSGAIEWLWNTNSYMTEGNEVPIGALRADATEKPEATVMRDMARFSKSVQEHLRNPQRPSIAVITSQAAQFSALAGFQVEAQRKAVRALAYDLHLASSIVAENQIEKLGSPRLVILPSAQALQESTWQALLKYVKDGGNLLITGPLARDEHWQLQNRTKDLGFAAAIEPLAYHGATIRLQDKTVSMSFGQQEQFVLESLRFEDGSNWQEVSEGQGKIFWSSYPVELADGLVPASDVYRYVAAALKLKPAFETLSPIPSNVLVYVTELQDSVLYIVEAEYDEDTQLDLRDAITGARLTLKLPALHAAMALIDKHQKSVVAQYGF